MQIPIHLQTRSHTLQQQAELGGQASGDLTILLTAIQTTCKTIAMNVRRARLLDLWVQLALVFVPQDTR